MTNKIENIKIAGTMFDGRRKLTLDQHGAIIVLYREGYSQRRLAAMFGVSKWLVQSIVTKPTRTANKKRSSEYWRNAKQKYRAKKLKLYKDGKIS